MDSCSVAPFHSLPGLKNISAKKGPVDRTYTATLGHERVALFAASDGQARQKAIEHFKPKRRDLPNIIIELVG